MINRSRPITVFTANSHEAVVMAQVDKDSRALTTGPGTLSFHQLIAEHGAGVFKTLYVPLDLKGKFKTPAGGEEQYL